jgi:hypothetical protein
MQPPDTGILRLFNSPSNTPSRHQSRVKASLQTPYTLLGYKTDAHLTYSSSSPRRSGACNAKACPGQILVCIFADVGRGLLFVTLVPQGY